ncbi:Ig-like domain-containing protein [Colwellia echini]|uniref:Family 16 glycosylhydrolase n=1 Tax=Colwellia echini TaxID=1982103 RepID=A0ABY3MYJ9_9GAMM|nr:Ig-like domain-containing protein [Colwellia echini]TYK66254.1 family 16 glycosylhydrolase [Colwellia echini]
MNKLKMLFPLAISFLSINNAAAVDIPPPLSDPNNNGDWVINPNVSDEFNADSFDRNVWFNQGENGQWNGQWRGRAPSEYNPDNIRVENGYVYLTARWDPNYNFSNGNGGGNSQSGISYGEVAPVTTAALLGKNTFQYGYMEMRSMAANGPISSSYWTTGRGGETDAFESYGWNPNNRWSSKRFHTSFHDWRVPGSSTYGTRIWDNAHILDFNVADGFHTYGFEWDPNYVAIYIDGALINCVTRAEMGNAWVATAPHRAWIDMEIFDWEVRAEDLRSEHFNGINGIDFVIDYARVYQRSSSNSGGTCQNRTNLLTNSGFENGMNGWSGAATSITSAKHTGNRSASLATGTSVEQVVQVKPNTTYMLSAVANSVNTNERDRWYNAYLGVRGHGSPQADVRYFFPRWQEKSLQFTTAANTTEVTVFFTNQPQGGLTYVDEIQLIEVNVDSTGDIAVTGVDVTPAIVTISEDSTTQLSAAVSPSNASNKNITWSSNNTSTARVNDSGLVTAVNAGTSNIVATTEDGSFTDTTRITVTSTPDTPSDDLVANKGFESGSLTNWSASYGNSSVVNNNLRSGSYAGYLNGNGAIVQDITVQANTTYTLSAWVKVGANGQSAYFGVKNYGGAETSRRVTSTGYTLQTVTFTTGSSNNTARIYLWNGDAGQRAYVDDVTIAAEGGTSNPTPNPDTGLNCSANWVPVSGIELNNSTISMQVGQQLSLDYSIYPSCATQQKITVNSTNWSVVAPNNNGTITARRTGTVTVTITSKSGDYTDTVTVNVR